MESIKKIDNSWFGFILGIISPVIGFFLYYFLFFKHVAFHKFMELFLALEGVQGPIISIVILIDGVLFFLFIKLNYEKLARGLVFGTLMYFPLTIYLKFIR